MTVRSAVHRAPRVLREFALLADGERGAIVGPHGDIAWLCVPRWDSPSLFATLIGGTGSYLVTPTERHVWGGYYEEGSMIWRSRWVTDAGMVESREALAFPADPDRAVLLRRVHALDAAAGEFFEAFERERKMRATLGGDERVDFVEDDGVDGAEKFAGL